MKYWAQYQYKHLAFNRYKQINALITGRRKKNI